MNQIIQILAHDIANIVLILGDGKRRAILAKKRLPMYRSRYKGNRYRLCWYCGWDSGLEKLRSDGGKQRSRLGCAVCNHGIDMTFA